MRVAQSVLRYSIRSIRSSSESRSPKVWPPLLMPKRAVSTMNLAWNGDRRAVEASSSALTSVNFQPTWAVS